MFSPIILILLGLALAFLGRRFIWLIVGAAGFVLAYEVVAWLLPGDSTLQTILATVAGVLLALLTKTAGKLILNIAGFILIGMVLLAVAAMFGIAAISLGGLIFFIVGGLIGLAILRFAFDNALVVISALGGAALVAAGLRDAQLSTLSWLPGLAGLAVAVLGFLYQWRELHGGKAPKGTPAAS